VHVDAVVLTGELRDGLVLVLTEDLLVEALGSDRSDRTPSDDDDRGHSDRE
jgi:hypothetical protein